MSVPEYHWFRATRDGDAWTLAAMPTAPDIVLSITSDLSVPLDKALATEAAIQQVLSASAHPVDYMICRVDGGQPARLECWYKR